MAIKQWDPRAGVRALAHRVERAVEPVLQGRRRHPVTGTSSFSRVEPTAQALVLEPLRWQGLATGEPLAWPAIDVYEDQDEVVLSAELPGVDRSELEVRVEDSNLTLQGELKLARRQQPGSYLQQESCYGSFVRSFALPSDVDQDRVRAELRAGILQIHLPKRVGAAGKTIQIQG